MKNSVLDNFPPCPPAQAPPEKCKFYFYCRLALSDIHLSVNCLVICLLDACYWLLFSRHSLSGPLRLRVQSRSRTRLRIAALRAQRLKKFKILKFSSEIESLKRATHQPPIFCGNPKGWGLKFSSDIESFKRDWFFQSLGP